MIKIIAALLLFTSVTFGETIPPKPAMYFTDSLGVVSREQALAFNEELAQYERETSNQVLIVTYPFMETEGDPALYATSIANAWQVGQKDKRNGLVLFFWDKTVSGKGRLQIAVGYGLEGAVPDITATRITEHIKPYVRKDAAKAFRMAIDDIKREIGKEHTGTGATVAESNRLHLDFWSCGFPLILFLLLASVSWIVIWRRGVARKLRREERIRKEREAIQAERQIMRAIKRVNPIIYPTPVYRAPINPRPKPRPSPAYVPYVPPSSDYSSSSSSSYDSGSSSSSFDSGGGSFGGGGGGSDV